MRSSGKIVFQTLLHFTSTVQTNIFKELRLKACYLNQLYGLTEPNFNEFFGFFLLLVSQKGVWFFTFLINVFNAFYASLFSKSKIFLRI